MEITCSYDSRIGSVFPPAMQNFIKINPDRAEEFFRRFHDLGVSNMTGYVWSDLTAQVRNPERSAHSQISALPGTCFAHACLQVF